MFEAFLGRFTGPMGMAMLFCGLTSFTSLAISEPSVVPFQEPSTECHPSLSGCRGRSLSPGGNPSGLANSSKSTNTSPADVQTSPHKDLVVLKKKAIRDLHLFHVTVSYVSS